MPLVFGFDIGTTSIGFAVIDHDPEASTGRIARLGVRIFPETRDPKGGAPLNQERRQARLRRRQLRRRGERLRKLHHLLSEAGLLPVRNSPEWQAVMKSDPYDLRARAVGQGELKPHEVGRALYHLAKRRHFKGRDLEEDAPASEERKKDDVDEKKAKVGRQATLAALKDEKLHLGAWLAKRDPLRERRRDVHATRETVEAEFDRICEKQDVLDGSPFKDSIREAIFAQRPVFWRLNTLGECRFMPGKPPCPKGAWPSQQRRMLEKVNNLEVAGGNARPLDEEERRAILDRLQTQASMTWSGARRALAPLFKARGEPGAEKRLKFNLEVGGDKQLLGNAVEARLAAVFGGDWPEHPRKQEIRDAVHDRLWNADYGTVGDRRVVILPAKERGENRKRAARSFVDDFGATEEQAAKLAELKLPTGWEPYSTAALRAILPRLEEGVRFGALVNGPQEEGWRNETFPLRRRPTGEVLDRLPSPTDKEERERIARLRNPTVVRTQNELRKVVNNLIDMFGKPDLICVEMAREVGKSKSEREKMTSGIREQERRRNVARKALIDKGITEPSRRDIEKWMLWEESGKRCPYTGDCISFDSLFGTGEFNVEHIWPLSRSLDDSFRNKTLCRRDENVRKGDRTPHEYLHMDAERWAAVKDRLDRMQGRPGKAGMSPGKIRRFLTRDLPDDFAARQLNDTGYAAREAVAFLKRLWPDLGPEAPVTVRAVSGRVTAQLRKLWSLNNILADDGEKTREDHRHHAVDALTVACAGAHPGMTQRLSRYWQEKDSGAREPRLPPPWGAIRADATKAVGDIVVSHRVRKKVSGALHKETYYGNTGETEGEYSLFVTRKPVEELSSRELKQVRDDRVREVVQKWVEEHGGDPKKAFPLYPKLGRKGPEIRKVRLLMKRQSTLMAKVTAGCADLGNNHHIALFRFPDGRPAFEVVSLFEASRRLSRKEPVIRRGRDDGAEFLMSLSQGDTLKFPGSGNTIRIVEIIRSNGQVAMVDHTDATGATKFQPKANTIVRQGARKISVDPIGRMRPAND